MKYTQIIIKPNLNRDDWDVTFNRDNQDRVEADTFPNANGYFSCPETKPLKDGFAELKAAMIESHVKEIEKLQKSLESLKKLELKKK